MILWEFIRGFLIFCFVFVVQDGCIIVMTFSARNISVYRRQSVVCSKQQPLILAQDKRFICWGVVTLRLAKCTTLSSRIAIVWRSRRGMRILGALQGKFTFEASRSGLNLSTKIILVLFDSLVHTLLDVMKFVNLGLLVRWEFASKIKMRFLRKNMQKSLQS